MNRKGHIPTALLLPAALVFAVIILFTFVSFDNRMDMDSKKLSELVNEINFQDRLAERVMMQMVSDSIAAADVTISTKSFEDGFRDSLERFAGNRNHEDLRELLDKIAAGGYKFSEDDGEYTLVIEDGVIRKKAGRNEIVRSFLFEIKFNEEMIIR